MSRARRKKTTDPFDDLVAMGVVSVEVNGGGLPIGPVAAELKRRFDAAKAKAEAAEEVKRG